MTKDELIAFETEVAAAFNIGQIRAPVHLAGGNEDQLIRIFKDVRPGDWVLGTWRAHLHALLHGIPRDRLMKAILDGRSISLCWPKHRFLCSGIVAGCLPIAVGIAAGIKCTYYENKSDIPHVWCFIGDMAARTGAFHEARQYAVGHDLPIHFVIENNGKSVLTDTKEVWGGNRLDYSEWWALDSDGTTLYMEPQDDGRVYYEGGAKTLQYRYTLPFPHAGAGTRVQF